MYYIDKTKLKELIKEILRDEEKLETKYEYEIKRIGRLALGYKTYINRQAAKDEIEICMWDEGFTHRWTIASFEYNEKQDSYYLECSEYLVDVQDWVAFGALVTGGFKFLNQEI